MHTYSMRGCNRERYVFYIALTAVGVLAIAQRAAGYWGIAISVTTFSVFASLFYLFDLWAWKKPLIEKLVGVPDLSGKWIISGATTGADGTPREWEGTTTIEQSWSHIAISVETSHSRSRSSMAAIEKDPGHGYRLVYGYENKRKDIDNELRSHCGTCDAVVADDLQTIEAAYFNDHQRKTFGTMRWSRSTKN